MQSTDEEGLSSDRVREPPGIDFSDIQCSVCHNILWKPIGCQSCETPFCSMCIAKWFSINPNRCPMRCDKFIERPCPRFITKHLAKLQIPCTYQSNGCNEVSCSLTLTLSSMVCCDRLFHKKHSINTRRTVIINLNNVLDASHIC
jgi:hypothetical protein